MARRREVRYAWNGDVALAYEVFGAGPVDLVYLQGYTSHVDLNWESPYLARFLRGLGERARVIHTDRRGWGCSDRFSPGDVAPLEVQVDDLVAVMDAAGSERAVVFTSNDTCLAGALFATTYPERTAGLVLVDPMFAYHRDTEDARRVWAETLARVRREWGTPAYFGEFWHDVREQEDWYARWGRASVAPGALVAEVEAFGAVDVRDVLPSIHAPTLLVGSSGEVVNDPIMTESNAYARAAQAVISGSRLIEPTKDGGAAWHHWYARGPAILAAVGELVASIREEQASFDRVLATVLFTDIVDSTATAAVMGDARWRKMIDEHDRMAKGLVTRYRGEFVDSTGDGLLATFDGPARAIRCAQAIIEAARPLGVEIRAGLHTGEVERAEHGIAGVGVHIGARVGAMAGAGEVWVSSTVKDLTAGSGLAFEDRGEHELKGVPDRWHLYQVARS
ncbi:MAG: adenylate/guanylate cyclase domain-containing protein [Chloroflexota bacterium]|nr:adenylate/guanylate cyclase domain-containing protein [Chloroflexota bacterium]